MTSFRAFYWKILAGETIKKSKPKPKRRSRPKIKGKPGMTMRRLMLRLEAINRGKA
jgi:hypothetical protein